MRDDIPEGDDVAPSRDLGRKLRINLCELARRLADDLELSKSASAIKPEMASAAFRMS